MLGRHLQLAPEAAAHHAVAGGREAGGGRARGGARGGRNRQVRVERVEEPDEERGRVGARVGPKPPSRRRQHGLHEFVGRHVTLERAGIPQFAEQGAKAVHEG